MSQPQRCVFPECGRPRGAGRRYCSRRCYHASRVIPIEVRLDQRIDRSGDCWIWTGDIDDRGYGSIWYRRKNLRAHRLTLELALGRPIKPGLLALHGCDNPPCVRVGPDHVYEGTAEQNRADMILRGRTTKGKFVGERHPGSWLTTDAVLLIREWHAKGVSQERLGRAFKVTASHIHKIVTRQCWTHL